MFEHRVFLQGRGNEGVIQRGLVQTATKADFESLSVAVAYATRIGCESLAAALQSRLPQWRRMEKKWLVSVDRGVTDPEALVFLGDLPRSEVRVPSGESVLAQRLRPKTRFHSKVYVFAVRSTPGPFGIFSGSANLTLSGLNLNDECATSSVWMPPVAGAMAASLRNALQETQRLEGVFTTATAVSAPFLRQYRALRASQPVEPEDDRDLVRRVARRIPDLPLDKAVALATARSLWVEVQYVVPNRGAGNPGNQIDLKRGTRVFFGFPADPVPKNSVLGSVGIRYGGNPIECHMRYGNNLMDKLNLPIPGVEGPPSYENRTLLFERQQDGSYELSVGRRSDIARWQALSNEQGTAYTMQSGRRYGVFTIR